MATTVPSIEIPDWTLILFTLIIGLISIILAVIAIRFAIKTQTSIDKNHKENLKVLREERDKSIGFQMQIFSKTIDILMAISKSTSETSAKVDVLKDRVKDFREDRLLSSLHEREKGKKRLKKEISIVPTDRKKFDDYFNQFTQDIFSSSAPIWFPEEHRQEREEYIRHGEDFEKLVEECFLDLDIPYKKEHLLDIGIYMPDFLANKKDGKNVPVEVKFYRKRVIGNELPSRLVRYMKEVMDAFKTDESIIVISSEVTNKAMKIFRELSKPKKIHIVVGDTKEKLKGQLAKILL